MDSGTGIGGVSRGGSANRSRWQSTRRHGLAVVTVLSAAALGGASACGSGLIRNQAAPGSSGTAQTSQTSQTPVASAASGPGAGAATAPKCVGKALKITLGREGTGSQTNGTILYFTNKSGYVCTIQGYPGVTIMRGSEVLLNAQQSLNGYIGDQQTLTSAPLVVLAPGATASAEFEDSVDAGQPCYPAGSGTLTVTPPNDTDPTPFMPEAVGSEGVCSDFEVHPVVPGLLR